ncbi:MAG: hypothetical protein M1550_03750 [Deltaproteobacteria bacterium]|nr:hypothetical protein [Deltaproteobacteria bacterium]
MIRSPTTAKEPPPTATTFPRDATRRTGSGTMGRGLFGIAACFAGASARRAARMWSGVVPQQPAITSTPSARNLAA